MCGICGLVDPDGVAVETLRGMTDGLAHRGPDGEGVTVFGPEGPADAGIVGLGHRRLAILDLSTAGIQPMRRGHLWITFNGEVFNYLELRAELEGLGERFATGTDTEVMLAAYDRWGEDCVTRFEGMWAFAIWDTRRRRLFASRDRFGIKPLLYVWDGRRLAFASEVHVLLGRALPARADEEVVRGFLTHELVDAGDRSFFAGVRHLPAATSMTLDLGALTPAPRLHRYWALDPDQRLDLPEAECAEAVEAALRESIHVRLRSDVPVGSCLSGGLDSSAVVGAMASELGAGTVRTFSAVFPGFALDEERYVDEVHRFAGTVMAKVSPTGDEFLADLGTLVRVQGEPFGSPSIYAQWRVMRLAREAGVPVLLDGQGGDELFAGYPASLVDYALDQFAARRPREALAAAKAFPGAGPTRWALILAGRTLPEKVKDRLLAAARRRRFPWVAEDLVRGAAPPARPSRNGSSRLRAGLGDMLARTHLPGFLRYEDRNSMAFSIEARIPFLDHRLVELAFSLPDAVTLGGGRPKRVLRRAIADLVPAAVLARTDKVGFATPESTWLSGPLSDRLDALERDPGPWLDPAGVRAVRAGARAGDTAASRALWRALSVELWRREMGVAA